MSHARRRHLPLRRSRRSYAALVLAGAAAATAVTVTLVATAGAHQSMSSAVKVNANRITARAAAPAGSTTDYASLPAASSSTKIRTPGNRLPFLSPLGSAGLKAAKASAPAQHGSATRISQASPTRPSTPDGALQGIDGMKDSTSVCAPFGCQPPDHAIAASDRYVVQAVNTSLAIYDTKKGKQKGKSVDLGKFFKVPAPSPSGCDPDDENLPFLSDPRAFYDPSTGRFVVAVLQLEGAFGVSPACDFVSRYWVAVSKKVGNPKGKWNIYSFDTGNIFQPGDAADYTQLGFDSEAIFIGGNQFDNAGNNYLGAWTLAIPKATAEAGGAIPFVDGFAGYTVNDGATDRLLDTVQPVTSLGDGAGGPAGELLIASFNESVTESKVVLFDFSNALNQQADTQTISAVTLDVSPYAQPPLADDYPDCTDCLETIDNRISGTPVYMHGMVYATHDSAVDNGTDVNANVHWIIARPELTQPTSGCTLCTTITGADLVDDGYITYAGATDTWFGVIQPDREGNPFIGFEYGSTTSAVSPSSAYVARRATAPVGSGFDNGFFLTFATNGTDNFRWGDYEAVTFDGWDTNNIWFATEYSDVTRDWGTHLDKVKYTSMDQQ